MTPSKPPRPCFRVGVVRAIATASLGVMVAFAGAISPSTTHANPLTLVYEASLGPLPVFEAEISLDLRSSSFGVTSDIRPVAMFSKLYDVTLLGSAAGSVAQGALAPREYQMDSAFKQQQTTVKIAYQDRGRRAVRIAPLRQGQKAAEAKGALDPLSSLANLVAQLSQTGACPNEVMVFDGWRTFGIAVETAGTVQVPAHPRSIFSGQAVQCRFSVNQDSAGPQGRGSNDYLAYMRHGTIYLGEAVSAAPRVPVLVEAGDPVGGVRLYLRKAGK